MASDDGDGLDVEEGVDSGDPVDAGGPAGHGATVTAPQGAAEQVDGTGNDGLLAAGDEHTGGPGQELSTGEG